MDGIAVVSLAIQLVDSVREIQRFLRDVSEAPKELRRLIDLLEQLELILENIGALVERQQQQAADPAIDMSASILRAMRTCESKLKLLEDVMEAAKKTSSANGKVKRTFGSFKLACKKKDIEEFESQLHDAISLLNLAMTTNLTVVHAQSVGHLLEQVTATHRMTTTISKELLLVRNPSKNITTAGCSADAGASIQNSRPPAGSTFSKRRSMTVSTFSGPLGRLIVKREFQNSNFGNEEESTSINTHHSESSAWIFMPSFLSYAFDYRYLNTCGYVERALRTYPILPLEHPVWDMCERGDLTGIQKLLGDRQISPFSVDENGDTLLHFSARGCQAELCKFLFQIGFTGGETNDYGLPVTAHYLFAQDYINYERTYEVLSSHVCISDPRFFSAILFNHGFDCMPPEIFDRIVYDCCTKDNIADSAYAPLAAAVERFVRSSPNLRYQWKPIIRHLISLEADLHQGYFKDKQITILDNLMNALDGPFESRSVGQAWLDVLTESGKDVVKYLRTEYQLHFDPSTALPMNHDDLKFILNRRRYLIISLEMPSVSWDWFIDSEGQAYDVLEEFKNFGIFHSPLGSRLEKANLHWPMAYSRWQWFADMLPWRRFLHPDNTILVHRANVRFKRRCERKAVKLAKAQGIFHKGPKMPGAWID